MEQLQNLLNHWKGNGEVVILESSCNPADSTMDSSIKLAKGTHETNTAGDDETNATGNDALVLETLVQASRSAVETFFSSQDSSIKLAEGTREMNTLQLVTTRRVQLVMMLLYLRLQG
ncbi:hypothetical protein RRG08_003403 [Elysia crispata]|uniref:Uncharacterized protein n=1 Tax=Elysia crispata TaxID=231223 RepID=A0AAE1AB03_9GAST|nr:hypothetical protein RRG08_003403 [Elysia crispata]